MKKNASDWFYNNTYNSVEFMSLFNNLSINCRNLVYANLTSVYEAGYEQAVEDIVDSDTQRKD